MSRAAPVADGAPESVAINREDQYADASAKPGEQGFRHVRVDQGIEIVDDEAATIRARTGASLKRLFGDCQRTGPRSDFHRDTPNQRNDVQRGEHRTVARQDPSKENEENPEQVSQ